MRARTALEELRLAEDDSFEMAEATHIQKVPLRISTAEAHFVRWVWSASVVGVEV